MSTMLPVPMRLFVASLVVVLASLSSPAAAQDPPPPIPWVVVDLHASVPRFSSDDQELADSRGMSLAELPGRGLGVQVGLHLYPLHTHVVTFGVGGELAYGRSSNTPQAGATQPDGTTPLRPAEEKFLSLAPQVSLNFGNGSGWSYLSVGLGGTRLSLVPQGAADNSSNTDRLKTFDYGGGARWFIKKHLAFSLDARFYEFQPGTPIPPQPGSPHTQLFIISAGISMK